MRIYICEVYYPMFVSREGRGDYRVMLLESEQLRPHYGHDPYKTRDDAEKAIQENSGHWVTLCVKTPYRQP